MLMVAQATQVTALQAIQLVGLHQAIQVDGLRQAIQMDGLHQANHHGNSFYELFYSIVVRI